MSKVKETLSRIHKDLSTLQNDTLGVYDNDKTFQYVLSLSQQIVKDAIQYSSELVKSEKSATQKLINTCVKVNESQCELLLKALEDYTDFVWTSCDDPEKPTEWNPFKNLSEYSQYIYIVMDEDVELSNSKDPIVDYDLLQFGIVMEILTSSEDNCRGSDD